MDGDSTWQPRLSLMDRPGIEWLHRASIGILENTGLNVHHPGMREKLLNAGARPGPDAPSTCRKR